MGEYSANIFDNGSREDGEYIFAYKNSTPKTSFKNLEIVINDGETQRKETNFKGATIEISTSCSGCLVSQKDKSINVNIKWDNGKEESFVLESQ